MISLPDFRYRKVVIHFVHGRGEKICFRGDNLVILDRDGKTLARHTCHQLFALFIIGEITVTSVLMRYGAKYQFPIILMGDNLKVTSRIGCVAEGNTALRKIQYADSPRNFCIAKELVRLKIHNQVLLLKRIRQKSRADKEAIEEISALDLDRAEDIHMLMGVEGAASKIFFKVYFRNIGWNRREPRCKRDIPNLLLDIGYTYLFNFVESILSLYGFDLYCGVLHTFFYQRKSLVCDLVEPFRCIIDYRIRKAYNLGQIDESDFGRDGLQYYLPWKNQDKYVRLFMKDIMDNKEEIFLFCQTYYRWFARGKNLSEFPRFTYGE